MATAKKKTTTKTAEKKTTAKKATAKKTAAKKATTKKTAAKKATAKKATAKKTVNITHEEIAQRAFEIWQASGCIPGRDEANWEEAEKQLKG